jgi:hypothetical protein
MSMATAGLDEATTLRIRWCVSRPPVSVTGFTSSALSDTIDVQKRRT